MEHQALSHTRISAFLKILIFTMLVVAMLSFSSTAFAKGATEEKINGWDSNLASMFDQTSVSANFRIHYTLTAPHAVPSVGYVAQVSAVLEEVYNKIKAMEYKELPGSGGLYNVYLRNLNGNSFGSVEVNPTSMTDPDTYLFLDNNYTEAPFDSIDTPVNVLKSTVAHQLFLAFQMGYNVFNTDTLDANIWWREASAAWMEDEIYPNLNHYLNNAYTDDPGGAFAFPDYPLEASDMEFSNVMFVKYIAQKAGGGANGQELIRRIWVALEGKNFTSYPTTTVFKYIVSTLNSEYSASTTLPKLIADYAVQNFVVDSAKTPGLVHYSTTDANDLKNKRNALWADDGPAYAFYVKAENINSSTANKTASSIANLPQYLGANYNVVNASSSTKTVKLQFTGGLGVENPSINPVWMVKVLLRRVSNGTYDIKSLVTNARSNELTITGFGTSGTYNQAVFVVIPVTPSNLDIGSEDNFQYSYSLRNASSILKYSYSGSSTIQSTTYYYGSSTGIVFRARLRNGLSGSSYLNNQVPVPILEKSTTGLANSWITADALMTWNNTLKRYVSNAQKPARNMYYRVRWVGTNTYADSVSGKSRIYVVPKITIKAADYSISKGQKVKISGIVSPNHAGKNVYVQIFDGSKWTTLQAKLLNSSSAYGIFWTPTKKGKFGFRTRFGDSDHKMSYSKIINIVVN